MHGVRAAAWMQSASSFCKHRDVGLETLVCSPMKHLTQARRFDKSLSERVISPHDYDVDMTSVCQSMVLFDVGF